jgi:hypothetical protein
MSVVLYSSCPVGQYPNELRYQLFRIRLLVFYLSVLREVPYNFQCVPCLYCAIRNGRCLRYYLGLLEYSFDLLYWIFRQQQLRDAGRDCPHYGSGMDLFEESSSRTILSNCDLDTGAWKSRLCPGDRTQLRQGNIGIIKPPLGSINADEILRLNRDRRSGTINSSEIDPRLRQIPEELYNIEKLLSEVIPKPDKSALRSRS